MTSPMGSSRVTLTRDDIIAGLREVVSILRHEGHQAQIQIVGGAAISLTIDAQRDTTRDVDGPLTPKAKVLAVAEKVAISRGWPSDWLNDEAAQFLPSGMGRSLEWETIHDDGAITVQVASAAMLLAMKLYAAKRRGQREADDLIVLLDATGTQTVEEAESIYSAFYPGDAFTTPLADFVERLLEVPGPERVPPPQPDLS